jgi:choline dehydrogenase-like flavoprotein
MRQRFGKRATLFGIADHLPDKNNRVTLSNTKTDELGMPKVNIDSRYSQQDLATVDAMNEKLDQWYKATPKARNKVASSSVKQASATHVAGTCRMGNNPKESVVDPWGKIWGIENGFIADGSVMPSQGCGDSPSLTIQALALRTAKRVAEYLNSA